MEKRISTLVVGFFIALCLSVCVFAEETSEVSESSGDILISSEDGNDNSVSAEGTSEGSELSGDILISSEDGDDNSVSAEGTSQGSESSGDILISSSKNVDYNSVSAEGASEGSESSGDILISSKDGDDNSVSAEGASEVSVSSGDILISSEDGDYNITGETNQNNIVVDGGNHTLTLNNLSIDCTGAEKAGIELKNAANVTIVLIGHTMIKSELFPEKIESSFAGIQVPQGCTLTIQGEGTLDVYSGQNGAAIGSCSGKTAGTINIESGTINASASGAGNGAGIGGGYCGKGGTVNISGGYVTASGCYSAGIGGGTYEAGGDVTITGGTIVATGKSGGAGIGGGGSQATSNGGTVVITGGNVYAKGESGGEAIGSGSYGQDSGTLTDGSGKDVYLACVNLVGGSADDKITAINIEGSDYSYRLNDSYPIEYIYYGKKCGILMYLPDGTTVTSVTAGDDTYVGTITADSTGSQYKDFAKLKIPKVRAVVIQEAPEKIVRGKEAFFVYYLDYEYLTGNQAGMTWSIESEHAAETKFYLNKEGDWRLKIAPDEPAVSITVRLTSDFDNTKYAEATIKLCDPNPIPIPGEQQGGVSGTVLDSEHNQVIGETVKLTKGGTNGNVTAQTFTDKDGKYSFANIPSGVYSLVANNKTQMITKTIVIKNQTITQDLQFPDPKINTFLEVKGVTPNVAADYLEQAVDDPANNTEIRLVVEKKTEAEAQGKDEILAKLNKNETVGFYLDAKLLQTEFIGGFAGESHAIQPNKEITITIDLPESLWGKKDYWIVRHHVDTTKKLKCYYDDTLHTLSFETDRFSTYAVAYIEDRPTSHSHSNSSKKMKYQCTASCSNGGMITPRGVTKLTSGKDLCYTITSDSGYELSQLIVDGSLVDCVTTYTFEDVRKNHTIEAIFTKAKGLPYQDVKKNKWYYDAVAYVYEHGLMNGVTDTEFLPELTTTRAEIVAVLWRMEGKPKGADCSFTDLIEGQYYVEAVKWAAKNGIVKGYSQEIFAPRKTVTREELAAIIYRYAIYRNVDTNELSDLKQFIDRKEISSWADGAMKWVVNKGIISGRTEKLIVPQGSVTRCELAEIIMRYVSK